MVKTVLIEELFHGRMQIVKEVCRYVEELSGAYYSHPGMLYLFRRLKVKKKTGRPVHYRKDEKGEFAPSGRNVGSVK